MDGTGVFSLALKKDLCYFSKSLQELSSKGFGAWMKGKATNESGTQMLVVEKKTTGRLID